MARKKAQLIEIELGNGGILRVQVWRRTRSRYGLYLPDHLVNRR